MNALYLSQRHQGAIAFYHITSIVTDKSQFNQLVDNLRELMPFTVKASSFREVVARAMGFNSVNEILTNLPVGYIRKQTADHLALECNKVYATKLPPVYFTSYFQSSQINWSDDTELSDAVNNAVCESLPDSSSLVYLTEFVLGNNPSDILANPEYKKLIDDEIKYDMAEQGYSDQVAAFAYTLILNQIAASIAAYHVFSVMAGEDQAYADWILLSADHKPRELSNRLFYWATPLFGYAEFSFDSEPYNIEPPVALRGSEDQTPWAPLNLFRAKWEIEFCSDTSAEDLDVGIAINLPAVSFIDGRVYLDIYGTVGSDVLDIEGEANHLYTVTAPNGKYFTYRDLLDAIAESQPLLRADDEYIVETFLNSIELALPSSRHPSALLVLNWEDFD